jgi:hypothetical protein
VELQTLTSAKFALPAILLPTRPFNKVTTYHTRIQNHSDLGNKVKKGESLGKGGRKWELFIMSCVPVCELSS